MEFQRQHGEQHHAEQHGSCNRVRIVQQKIGHAGNGDQHAAEKCRSKNLHIFHINCLSYFTHVLLQSNSVIVS